MSSEHSSTQHVPTTPVAPVLVRADAMASMLSLSRSSFYELARAGLIPAVHVGNARRFDPDEVLAALRSSAGTP
jgi:excisionase family DNA binding protein